MRPLLAHGHGHGHGHWHLFLLLFLVCFRLPLVLVAEKIFAKKNPFLVVSVLKVLFSHDCRLLRAAIETDLVGLSSCIRYLVSFGLQMTVRTLVVFLERKGTLLG